MSISCSNNILSSRASNIELLRILSMFLVLLIHYVPTRINDVTAWGGSELCLRSVSVVCVHCFILISGYFGIRWRLKSILKLLLQISFWGIFCYSFARFLGWTQAGLGEMILVERDVLTRRWFISAYLLLYLLAPVLNSFIEKSPTSLLEKYLLVFYGVSSVFGWCLRSLEFNEGMSLVSLVGIYLSGGYLRKTERKIFHLKAFYNLCIFFLIALGMVLVTLLARRVGINRSPLVYLNPLVCLQAVFLFLGFREWHIPSNRLVNWIAASAFSVYLFHCHPFVWLKIEHCCHWVNEHFNCSLLVVLSLMILLFGGCVVIDKVFSSVFDFIWGCLGKTEGRKC